MPNISVVISSFNRERFIAEAIQSVLDQTSPPLEIIVVDDGSTDQTEQVVRSLSGAVPIYYHRRLHQGQAATNNFGVSMAKGDWVAFLDSDDLWYPHKLAVQVAALEAHPGVPFFYCKLDYARTDELGHEIPAERGWDSVLIPLIFQGQPNASVPAVLLRKDVFVKEGGFNPSLRIGVSWELFVRIAHKYPIHYIPQSLAKQRLHSGQVTRDLRGKTENYHRFHACLYKMWSDDPAKQAILLRDTARLYADLGRQFLGSGDYFDAQRCFRWSLSYRPLSWKNWRRLGISYLPGLREWYGRRKATPEAH